MYEEKISNSKAQGGKNINSKHDKSSGSLKKKTVREEKTESVSK